MSVISGEKMSNGNPKLMTKMNKIRPLRLTFMENETCHHHPVSFPAAATELETVLD
jgi:hypothetical protein